MKRIKLKVSKLLLFTILGLSISTIIFANSDPFHVPGSPGKPDVDNVGDTYVSLNWTAARDNGSPILNYHLDKREIKSSHWRPTRMSGRDLGCVLGGLMSERTYIFSVYAENLAGCGRRSVSSDPVTTTR